ncbi:MAG: septum formation protein Maf [Opitutales bacterium]|nr:septum formation protein Maf [Opitutales bacterium]
MDASSQKANQNPSRSFILASGSPRRKQLLKKIIPDFKVISSDAEELKSHSGGPLSLVQENAKKKAIPVAANNPSCWVLGADTLVFYQKEILGKPKDLDEAVEMLSFLSGKTHEVATGVSLQCNELNIVKTFSETSSVTFKPISKQEIRLYFKEVNPLDKAGAYAIQTNADMIIDRFVGSYSNVVGLPLESLGKVLKELSIS